MTLKQLIHEALGAHVCNISLLQTPWQLERVSSMFLSEYVCEIVGKNLGFASFKPHRASQWPDARTAAFASLAPRRGTSRDYIA